MLSHNVCVVVCSLVVCVVSTMLSHSVCSIMLSHNVCSMLSHSVCGAMLSHSACNIMPSHSHISTSVHCSRSLFIFKMCVRYDINRPAGVLTHPLGY